MTELELVKRLFIICLLAGLIGYERERVGRAAGFRTHILVGLGSCLILMTGFFIIENYPGMQQFDPTRMGAQVVSGIGFLGAGTIIRSRASIRGLTTAASLWAVGGIGLAIGAGFITGGVITGLLIAGVLFGLSGLERSMRRGWDNTLVVETTALEKALVEIRSLLSEHNSEIRDLEIKLDEDSKSSRLEIQVKLFSRRHQEEIQQELLQLDIIRKAHWI